MAKNCKESESTSGQCEEYSVLSLDKQTLQLHTPQTLETMLNRL